MKKMLFAVLLALLTINLYGAEVTRELMGEMPDGQVLYFYKKGNISVIPAVDLNISTLSLEKMPGAPGGPTSYWGWEAIPGKHINDARVFSNEEALQKYKEMEQEFNKQEKPKGILYKMIKGASSCCSRKKKKDQ